MGKLMKVGDVSVYCDNPKREYLAYDMPNGKTYIGFRMSRENLWGRTVEGKNLEDVIVTDTLTHADGGSSEIRDILEGYRSIYRNIVSKLGSGNIGNLAIRELDDRAIASWCLGADIFEGH